MTLKDGAKPSCAACRYQRRRCFPDCPLAPYFPPDNPVRFENVHRLFGVKSLKNFLETIPEELREEAMATIIYQAEARTDDPVHGCLGIIKNLRYANWVVEQQLRAVMSEIQYYRSPENNNNNGQNHTQIIPGNQDVTTQVDLEVGLPVNYNQSNGIPSFRSGQVSEPQQPSILHPSMSYTYNCGETNNQGQMERRVDSFRSGLVSGPQTQRKPQPSTSYSYNCRGTDNQGQLEGGPDRLEGILAKNNRSNGTPLFRSGQVSEPQSSMSYSYNCRETNNQGQIERRADSFRSRLVSGPQPHQTPQPSMSYSYNCCVTDNQGHMERGADRVVGSLVNNSQSTGTPLIRSGQVYEPQPQPQHTPQPSYSYNCRETNNQRQLESGANLEAGVPVNNTQRNFSSGKVSEPQPQQTPQPSYTYNRRETNNQGQNVRHP